MEMSRNNRGNFSPSDISSQSIQSADTIILIAVARNLSAQAFFENGRRSSSRSMLEQMPTTKAFSDIVNAQELIRNELSRRGIPLSVI